MEFLSQDVQEIKKDVKELLQRSAVHNELLKIHEARSLALQKGQEFLDVRMKPLETQATVLGVVLKSLGVIASGAIIGALGNALLHLFI